MNAFNNLFSKFRQKGNVSGRRIFNAYSNQDYDTMVS